MADQIEQSISAQVLSLHDGDLLVLQTHYALTKEQADHMLNAARNAIGRAVPAGARVEVVLLADGLTIEQVSAADLRRLPHRDAEGQP